ncbi:MAG: hypothetical protein M0C28_20840 [Candidatus Moduliflexus flocculans]|nr:hypothetical protein [Candidatus Moduliflexus flocculans]
MLGLAHADDALRGLSRTAGPVFVDCRDDLRGRRGFHAAGRPSALRRPATPTWPGSTDFRARRRRASLPGRPAATCHPDRLDRPVRPGPGPRAHGARPAARPAGVVGTVYGVLTGLVVGLFFVLRRRRSRCAGGGER